MTDYRVPLSYIKDAEKVLNRSNMTAGDYRSVLRDIVATADRIEED